MPWPSDWQDLQPGSAANFNAWHDAIRKMASPQERRIAALTRSATLSVPNATSTVIPWDAAELNVGNMWSATQATRLTAPQADVYLITVQSELSVDSTTGERTLQLLKNGTIDLVRATRNRVRWPSLYWIGFLSAGEYVECVVFQDSGAAINLTFARLAALGLRGATP